MIGIDEVGRGSWAGPLLAVAARQVAALPPALADSKVLSIKKRQSLVRSIKDSCQLGEGWVQSAEIDALGLTAAMRLAVQRALTALGAQFSEEIIMDGHINYCSSEFSKVRCVINADATEPLVSAASIYAKVQRDQYMANASLEYADYGFDKNVGYGTKKHSEALKLYGICELHRRSYKPVQAFL